MGMYNNSYWAVMYINFRKSRWIWGVVSKLLRKMVAPIRDQDMMYKEVLHEVLLYGREI